MPNYNIQAAASIDMLRQVRETIANIANTKRFRGYSSHNGKQHEITETQTCPTIRKLSTSKTALNDKHFIIHDINWILYTFLLLYHKLAGARKIIPSYLKFE